MNINLLDFDYTRYPLDVFKNQICIDFLGEILPKNVKSSLNPIEQIASKGINEGLSRYSGMKIAALISEYKFAKIADNLFDELPLYVDQVVNNIMHDPSLLIPDTREMISILYMVSRTLKEMEDDAISSNLDDIGDFIVRYIKSGDWGLRGAWHAFTSACDEAANRRRFIYSEITRIYVLSIIMNYYVVKGNYSKSKENDIIKKIALELTTNSSGSSKESKDSNIKYYFFSCKLPVLLGGKKEDNIKDYVERNLNLFKNFVYPNEESDSKIWLWAKMFYEDQMKYNNSQNM